MTVKSSLFDIIIHRFLRERRVFNTLFAMREHLSSSFLHSILEKGITAQFLGSKKVITPCLPWVGSLCVKWLCSDMDDMVMFSSWMKVK
jgi:hypothetical protein